MPTPLPREPSGSSNLAQTVKQLIRCTRERTALESTDYSIERHADGFFQRPRVKSETRTGGSTQFRGVWFMDQFYLEGDIVFRRHGSAGGAGSTSGTFICIRDHTSTEENQPKEALPDEVDPVSSGVDDVWRTFSQTSFPNLTIKAYDIPVGGGPPIVNTSFARVNPDSMLCSSASGFVSVVAQGGKLFAETTTGGKLEIDCSALPLGVVLKPRLETICKNNEKYTAWFVMSAPELVP